VAPSVLKDSLLRRRVQSSSAHNHKEAGVVEINRIDHELL